MMKMVFLINLLTWNPNQGQHLDKQTERIQYLSLKNGKGNNHNGKYFSVLCSAWPHISLMFNFFSMSFPWIVICDCVSSCIWQRFTVIPLNLNNFSHKRSKVLILVEWLFMLSAKRDLLLFLCSKNCPISVLSSNKDIWTKTWKGQRKDLSTVITSRQWSIGPYSSVADSDLK